MKIGIPGGLMYHRYKPFIDTFVEELGAERVYSLKTNKKILDKGIEHCVDEACLPIKIFNGHVNELSDKVDAIIVPRIMQCEFGESICPKICGLPELSKKSAGNAKLAFSTALRINDRRSFTRTMVKDGKEIGFSPKLVKKSLKKAEVAQRTALSGIDDLGYKWKVLLAGHGYNVHDEFVNMQLIDKLHKMDIGVVTEDAVIRLESNQDFSKMVKKPYWLYFRNNYLASKNLVASGEIDGIIYLSSFNCGIDSIAIEFIKNSVADFPMLVLKLDEQSGEAGLSTRILAFSDIIKKERPQ